MSAPAPRAAVGSFPYPHRTVAEVDAAEGRTACLPEPRKVADHSPARAFASDRRVVTAVSGFGDARPGAKRGPSHTNIRPVDDSAATPAPARVVCGRCGTVNCERHAPASLTIAQASGWQRFVRIGA